MKRPPLLTRAVWSVARRELRSGVRGFGVFLTCLWLGVFAIAAVGSFSSAARRGILADARSILGGDLELELTHRPAPPGALAMLSDQGRVTTVAELRAMARAPGTAAPLLVELKAVEPPYPLYGTLGLEPPLPLARALGERDGTFGVAVAPVFLVRLGLAVGDRVRLGRVELTVRAVVVAEPDRAVAPFRLGPRVLISPAGLAATGLAGPGSLVRYRHRLALDGERSPAAVLAELDAAFPDAGWRGRTFRQAAPRVRHMLDRMTTQLTLVALFTLLIGGLGVAGAVRGYLDQKLAHVAVLKCLGASRREVFAAYLVQILLLGSLAAAGAVAAGAAVPWAVRWAGGAPFPLAGGVSLRPLASAAGFGLLVAVVFSAGALAAAARVSPAVLFRGEAPALAADTPAGRRRLAGWAAGAAVVGAALVAATGEVRLSAWFVAGAAGCFAGFRLLGGAVAAAAARVPVPRQVTWRLALANLARPGSVARSAVVSLGTGLTALAAVALVQQNLADLVARELPDDAPALFFFQIQEDQLEVFDAALAAAAPGATAERVPTLRGRITHIAGQPVAERVIAPQVRWAVRSDRFLTHAAALPAGSTVVAGAWWSAAPRAEPQLSLTQDLAEGFGVGVGDTLTVNVLGRPVTARIANLRRVDWSTLELNFALILSPDALAGAPLTYLAAVHLPASREAAALAGVTAALPNVSAVPVREVLATVGRVIERIGTVFRVMAGLALLTGVLVLAGALSAEQHRRVDEAVVYKVCGATRGDVLRVFGAEFLLVGLAAGAVSCLTGAAAAFGVVHGVMDLEFSLYPGTLVATAGLAALLTVALGLVGTVRALGRDTARHLRGA